MPSSEPVASSPGVSVETSMVEMLLNTAVPWCRDTASSSGIEPNMGRSSRSMAWVSSSPTTRQESPRSGLLKRWLAAK